MNVKYIIGKFASLLKEKCTAVISSSSMWVHSINKDRETHRECHIYWNMPSYLSEYIIYSRYLSQNPEIISKLIVLLKMNQEGFSYFLQQTESKSVH